MCLFLIPDENIFPFFGFVSYKSFLSTYSDYEVSLTVMSCMRKSLYWCKYVRMVIHTFSGQSRPSAFCNISLDTSHATTSCPLHTPGLVHTHSAAPNGPSNSGHKPIYINFNRGRCEHNPYPWGHKYLTVGCKGAQCI